MMNQKRNNWELLFANNIREYLSFVKFVNSVNYYTEPFGFGDRPRSKPSLLITPVATRIKTFTATDLALVDWGAWRHQRSQLESLRQTRLQQRHFRHDPDNYLLQLETKLLQSILPL